MNGDRERSLDWDQRLATERPGASYMRFSARAAGGWWRETKRSPTAFLRRVARDRLCRPPGELEQAKNLTSDTGELNF